MPRPAVEDAPEGDGANRNELFASGFGTSHQNATEVAEELGIGVSTLAEHLAAAQEKLLEELLAD